MRLLRLIGKSIVDFFRDNGLMLAGSMSYFIMMALVPFCLFILTLFGYLLGHYPEFTKFLLNRLVNLFPEVTNEITGEFIKLISFQGLGKVSLFLYGFLSFQVFVSIENSLNVVFKVKQKRHLISSVIISLVAVTFIIAFLLISFSATSVTQLLAAFKPYFPYLKIGNVTHFIIRFVLPFILVLFTVTMVYSVLPKVKIKTSHALKGALFTTILLEVAKHVFTWYVGTVVHFGRIYGSLTAFVVFLLWMFYSSCIFLIGAEIVHNMGSPKNNLR